MIGNRNDFRFFTDATAAARGGNGKTTPHTSFRAFGNFARGINLSLRKDYEEFEKEKAEIREEYSPKKAQEKIAEKEAVFKVNVGGKVDFLTNTLDRLAGNVRNTLERFAMIPPTQEGILAIDTAEKRIDTMTETEFLMFVKNHAENYQESAYLQAIAKKHGKDYKLPFEPEEAINNLDKLVPLLKEQVIANIGKDPVEHIEMRMFLEHEEGKPLYGQINPLVEYFDNLPIAVEDGDPIPELTNQKDLEDRLIKARQTCWYNNAKALWEEAVSIGSDIQRNGMTTENISKAERMIKIVNELFPEGKGNA